MKHKKHLLVLVLLADLTTDTAQALLVDRSNGLMYDNVLNVTWQQNSSHANTSGYSGPHLMDWASVNTWVTNLTFDGLTGWRLPTYNSINGSSFNYNATYNGATDMGTNFTSPKFESAPMQNSNLSLNDYLSRPGNFQADLNSFGTGTYRDQGATDLATNLQSNLLWQDTALNIHSPYPVDFKSGNNSSINIGTKGKHNYVGPVRGLDINPVPELCSFWLFIIGLLGLLKLNRCGYIG
jgi:hypothetical protein